MVFNDKTASLVSKTTNSFNGTPNGVSDAPNDPMFNGFHPSTHHSSPAQPTLLSEFLTGQKELGSYM